MKSLFKSLPMQILLAVFLGLIIGSLLPGDQLHGLGDVAKIVIHWVKLIAGPFLFLTIFASILQVQVQWIHGIKLIFIAVLNTAIALTFGIILSLSFFKGDLLTLPTIDGKVPTPPNVSIGLEGWIKTFMPSSIFNPIVNNEILLIALLALLLGIAVRKSGSFNEKELLDMGVKLEKFKSVLGVFLHWLIRLIPIAVFAIVTATVSQYGLEIFSQLGKFVLVVLLAFMLQVFIVYGTWIFGVAKHKPKEFWKIAKEPILYSLGVNSSLATLPLTLKALKELKVSDRSASLGAGVATNINNDGIILYEAMAVYFIVFSLGIPMEPWQMVIAAVTCIVAAMGITGIPEAGFISLSVVIGVLNLPTELLPLLLAVDWVLARFRSAVNVISDMTLSIAIDSLERKQ